MKENFYGEKKIFYLVHETFLFRESNPMNLFDDGKSFWGDNDVVLKYFCYCKTLNSYLYMWCDPFLQRFRNT